MKRNIKRIISISLLIVLVFSMCTASFAETTPIKTRNDISMQYTYHITAGKIYVDSINYWSTNPYDSFVQYSGEYAESHTVYLGMVYYYNRLTNSYKSLSYAVGVNGTL